MSPDEFEAVCLHCTRRYTTDIDWLIVGGIYYYSDRFDFYVISPFKAIPINIPAPFPNLPKLENAWGECLNQLMTEHIKKGGVSHNEGKLPVIDLEYELEGVKYVKPAPRMGKSKFWRYGRPRKNSTGLTSCPYVATTLPDFSADDWAKFKSIFLNDNFFHDTYENWTCWVRNEERNCTEKLMPIVRVNVDYAAFEDRCKKSSLGWTLSDLFECANEVFNTKVHDLINGAWDKEKLNIIVPEYIHLVVKEIGQDKANDLCSIFYISEILGPERREAIIENERLFFEYGVAIAASYAVKRDIGVVLYTRDTTYAWT